MINTTHCSAMYYEKKIRGNNPWITGPVAALSTCLAIASAAQLDNLKGRPKYMTIHPIITLRRDVFFSSTCTVMQFTAIIAAYKCIKSIYALHDYDVKND